MKQFKQLLASNGNLNTNILVRAYLSNPDESPEYAVALIDALVNQVRDCQNELLNQARKEPLTQLVGRTIRTTTPGSDWASKPANPVFYDETDRYPIGQQLAKTEMSLRKAYNRVGLATVLKGEDNES